MSVSLVRVRYLPLMAMAVVAIAGVGVFRWFDNSGQGSYQSSAQVSSGGDRVSALGRLEPNGEIIEVFAPTSIDGARVELLKVKQGQMLRRGETIAILDTYARRRAALAEAQRQVAIAQARLAQVQAGAKDGEIVAQERVAQRLAVELETEVAAQEATIARLQAELANAELENRRFQFLQAEGAVSASLRDNRQLTADVVRQQLREAEAQLQRIQRARREQVAEAQATLDRIREVRPVDVELAQAEVLRAQAGVQRAQAELDLAIVRAPQNGQVLKIHTRAGERVISLGQTQEMVAVAEVYEVDLGKVRPGQRAAVRSKNNAFPEVLRGEVVEVGLEIGKQDVLNTDPAAQFDARVAEVKILLDAPSSQRVAALTNLTVEVEIEVAGGNQ